MNVPTAGLGQTLRLTDQVDICVTRKIAEGGMGVVYEAQQIGVKGFEKTVAVKVLHPRLTKKQFTDLFIAEAKLVANLVHENIVQIYQLGRSGREYYIVMEYVNGISLAEFITRHREQRRLVPRDLAVYIASRIARGLAYAHHQADAAGTPLNIVHRDICPNNVLITTEGLPKIGDFGVAKAANMTSLGDAVMVGKLPYMAPEQATWGSVDHRADIFSLGTVLFKMLTMTTIRKVTKTNMETQTIPERSRVPWRALPADTPPSLRRLLRRLLAHDPARRFQDADRAAQTLEYFIYKDGYGPTIQTLEKYMREVFPELYVVRERKVVHAETPVDARTKTRPITTTQITRTASRKPKRRAKP